MSTFLLAHKSNHIYKQDIKEVIQS